MTKQISLKSPPSVVPDLRPKKTNLTKFEKSEPHTYILSETLVQSTKVPSVEDSKNELRDEIENLSKKTVHSIKILLKNRIDSLEREIPLTSSSESRETKKIKIDMLKIMFDKYEDMSKKEGHFVLPENMMFDDMSKLETVFRWEWNSLDKSSMEHLDKHSNPFKSHSKTGVMLQEMIKLNKKLQEDIHVFKFRMAASVIQDMHLIPDKEKGIYKKFLNKELKMAFQDLNKSAMFWSMNVFKNSEHKMEDFDCQKTFYILSTLAELISDKKSRSEEEIRFIKIFQDFFEKAVDIRTRKDLDKKNSEFKTQMIKTLDYIRGK